MSPYAQYALALLAYLQIVSTEILTPPYFNLAQGKKITATATCGDEGPELYCKLVGTKIDHDQHVIGGQVCDYCDFNVESKSHPPEYAVDGMETWWQSPPLSRGMKYNEVNLTIDLGQEFHVAYVFVRMGNSPRPGLWALEKSTDYGKTYKPWQYFSDSPQDCERYFGKESLQPITRDDTVICSTEYSKIVPLEGGEIPISLLINRPSANKYFKSSVLQEWTRATNVRLRLLRTKNLLAHLMSVARRDPTVTRRYFYSIKDISIGGRCMCNGHADTCDPADPESEASILVCRCQHNTCGPQCAQCCSGFEQKKWRISQDWNKFSCEPCNCHNHTSECEYHSDIDEQHLSLDINGQYEGGGVCKNCQHNTEGINCNKCKPTFYRPYGKHWDEIDVCAPCNCDPHYSTGNCAEETGQCECRPEFLPPFCNACAYGYYDYPNCKPCKCNLNGTEGPLCNPTGQLCPCKYNYAGQFCEVCADGYYSTECKSCECNMVGSVSAVCDKDSGNCTCKSKYAGRTCNQCEAGYYNYPTCSHCNCDTSGTLPNICDDITGQCICKEGFGGSRCDQCLSGFYMEVHGRERVCVPCNCSAKGSTSTSCSADGKCNCLSNFGGKQCDQCSPGHYKYSECLPCYCDVSGSVGSTCDDNGQCLCKPNFDGSKCDHCKEHFYNYPACEECNCDPRGVIATFAGCGSVPAGELCQCKNRVQGRICNDCKPLFWNLQEYNPLGCEECKCYLAGTVGGLGACNTKTGQCTCKLHVGERQCDQCQDGFYRLQQNDIFGCSECDCDIGGSIDNSCNKVTGQCRCNSRVEGRRCDRPIQLYYFPTLHQFQYEIEEGLTPSGPVRYRSSEGVFPEYSWKGYVAFSLLQNEVINIVHIAKPSLYRIVLKYANPLKDPVIASIIVTPESIGDTLQKYNVLLRPTIVPQLVTVAGEKGNTPAPFVMNPGNWTVTIKTNKEVLLDYFVLVPQAYYEATILTKVVDKPCVIEDDKLCRHFAYPTLHGYPATDVKGLVTSVNDFIVNPSQLKEIGAGIADIPIMNENQSELEYNIKIAPNGPYVLLVEYVTPVNKTNNGELTELAGDSMLNTRGIVTVRFKSGDGPDLNALVNLYDCPYTSPCRQVVINELTKIYVFNIQDENNVINLEGEQDALVGIKSIIAIPESEWRLDYVTPKPYCLRREGHCVPAVFPTTVDSKKVELESGMGGDRITTPPILDNSTVVVYLSPETEPLTIEAKVPKPGEYLFVVHYYQPDNPESKIDISLATDGQIYEAAIPIEHCPSNSGCRSLLKQSDGNTKFNINDNFTLIFKGNATRSVWLDYVLVVAEPDFKDSVLKEANKFDYTREFISKCAMNHYKIEKNETGFCRDAVFSITADYNSGTLGCFCDGYGSLDFECETFGGQCKCKPNVIGRTCSSCRPGYYGFPDCKPCHCPITAICDENGECICPTNVEGENCDRCKPLTFNFDVQRGCDACNCNPLGVVGNQLQCDADSGHCACKQNVIGRTCDHCVPGHFAFPECYQCHCNLAGTTDDVCDQDTAQCYCKKHVTRQACDTCKDEYFNLQNDNPNGCTKCHCFGKTTRCSSAPLYWAEIIGMSDWKLVNIEQEGRTFNVYLQSQPPNYLNESVIGAELVTGESDKKVVYFGAPNHYLGKRLTSYGGSLRYSIFYTSRDGGNAISAADVIIGGPNGYLVHNSVEQPPALENWIHEVRISEDEFSNLDGTSVTREQFMNTIVNITAIYIRATYWNEAVTTRLISVSLDIGVESPQQDWGLEPQLASSVEQCQCPPAYRGLSCEQCAEGHYRLSSGPHAGFCVPCQCNGHSNTCDVNTGICLDCQHSTMGDHCEQCIPGYHGEATHGTRDDCLICACPLPFTSNNFAFGCELSDNGALIACDCKPGYGGPRCEFCAAGYYGIPESVGDYCKPCNCSGNINIQDPGSCDSINGDCLRCMNNTAGAACNLCAPGFFGDAIFSKNCTACDCDEFGMDHCDSSTGTCVCRPGVIGDRCDRCEPNHWGLNSGQGCTPCDCALASESEQCDLNTGQCTCAKGVTGRHCDLCAAGYWNYTKVGCDNCNCNTGYAVGFRCNANGQCECLPGVIGEKCNRCPERWVLIPEKGCQECDSCTDALIFSVEDMRDLLSNETQDFKDKADSFFTTQRLNYISNQTEFLRPKVLDLKNVDLKDVADAVKQVESNAKNLLRSAEFAATDSENQICRASDLADDANEVLASVRENGAKAKEVVAHVAELATGLELSQQPKVDSALSEARQIRDEILEMNLQPKKEQALKILASSAEQLERMNIFVQPVNDQNKNFETLHNNTEVLKDKLVEMLQYIDEAQHKADAAERLNANNKASKFGNKVNSVAKQSTAAMENLLHAAHSIANASASHAIAHSIGENFGDTKNNVDKAILDMTNRITNLSNELPELRGLSDLSQSHAGLLKDRAERLRQLADQENNNSRTHDAYSAASAYSSIVDEIKKGKEAVAEAEQAVQKAIESANMIRERVTPAFERSNSFKDRAASSLAATQNELGPNITTAEKALDDARKMLAAADDENKAILLSLRAPPDPSLLDEIKKADNLNATIKDTLNTMSQLGGDLDKSKEFAQTLPKIADETVKMTKNMLTLLKDMQTMNPQISSTYDNVEDKQEDLERQRKEADEKLQRLKDLIEQARAVANRIQVGVTFDSQSTLQPRLPDTVDEMSTSTHVSAFFRTNEKNGLILYLGNPKDTMLRRTKSDDFMVLEIQNGYPYLVMDIGDGAESGKEPARIGSDKYVADNRWYQVIVDRVGRNVKLSIRESLENGSDVVHTKEAVLPGQHTIFNLDRDKSKIYVGGAPSDALPKLQGISYPAFEGQIEELMIGDTPVGLWNFASSANLRGARQRDKLLTSQSGPQEYRFNGRGHITIPGRRYLQPDKNQVLLYFKTYAPDGLIYLVGDKTSYFSIYMQGGHVVLEAALGEENKIKITSPKPYNDGKWHKLDAARYQTVCQLHVDNDPPIKGSTSGKDAYIHSIDIMSFGGDSKGIVFDNGFDGCIRQISIDRVNIDLSENIESIGFAFGCQFASLVSLSGNTSFLHYVNVTADHLQLTLKFKTSEPDGLIFVYFSRTQTSTNQDSISLSLVKGSLKLMSQREVLDTALKSYNDSHWHVVSVTHSDTALKMVVDDFDYFSTDTAPAPLHILDGVLFVGGLQPGYVLTGKVGSKVPFSGCIADATVNGRLLNLLEPFNNNSITFGRCGATTTTGGVPPDQVQWPVSSRPDILPTAMQLPVSTYELNEHVEAPSTKAYRSPEVQITTTDPPSWPAVVTTTRSPPTTRRPPPAPEQGCALAYDPLYTLGDPDEGYRFGTRNDSRIEYARLPGRQHDGFDLTITFRTFDKHGGLLFYAAAEKSPQQFLAVYMKDGKLTMAFNCGADTVVVRTEQTFADTEWHTVTIVRNGGGGKISVDNEPIGQASGMCLSPAALAPPFYYGGLRDVTPDIRKNLEDFYQSFKGCLKGLLMNGQRVTDILFRVNSLQCRDDVEEGIYFGPSTPNKSNYLVLDSKFRVGREITISLEIKPRNSTGLLLSVHGGKDYLVLELLENEVVANVENGKGPFRASYKLGNKFSLCDGQWHKIHTVKSSHVVSVGVDGHFSDPGIGESGSTDTKSALYIGGHERDLSKVKGVRSQRGYVGCMRNIVIKEKTRRIPLNAAHGNVHVGVCPTD